MRIFHSAPRRILKRIFCRLTNWSHITPAHVASRRTSATKRRRPTKTPFTYSCRCLSKHLSNLSATCRYLYSSKHLTPVLKISASHRLRAMSSSVSTRIQPTSPGSRRYLPKLWLHATFFLNHSALSHAQGFQLFSTGLLPQVFFFHWRIAALYSSHSGSLTITIPPSLTLVRSSTPTSTSTSGQPYPRRDLAQPSH